MCIRDREETCFEMVRCGGGRGSGVVGHGGRALLHRHICRIEGADRRIRSALKVREERAHDVLVERIQTGIDFE